MDPTQADWTAKPRSAQLEFQASVGADVAAARLRGHAYALPCDAWIGDQAPGGVTLPCTFGRALFTRASYSARFRARGGDGLSCAGAEPCTIDGEAFCQAFCQVFCEAKRWD